MLKNSIYFDPPHPNSPAADIKSQMAIGPDGETKMFVTLFNQYWWLLFPLAFGLFGLIRMVLKDDETRRTMALIRSYTDQGKEPPAELLALLKR
jgi:hypothetical protein